MSEDQTATFPAPGLLRPGLLEGATVIVAGPAPEHDVFAEAVAAACAQLGAAVQRLSTDADEPAAQAAAGALASESGEPRVLVCDVAGALAATRSAGGGLGLDATALTEAMAGVWNCIRAAGAPQQPRPTAERIITIAPPQDAADPLADAARAALENLARTLSVEWARHGITVVSIAPAGAIAPAEVAILVAFLASPAGAYYSGCQLDLRGPQGHPGP